MSILFRPGDWPIAAKLLIAFLLISLVPLVIVGLLSQNQARQGLLTEARRNLENTARRTSTVIDEFLKSRVTDMQQTATLESAVAFIDQANNDRNALGPNNRNQTSTFGVLKSKANSLLVAGSYLALASKSGQVELTSNNTPNQEGQAIEGEPRDLSSEVYFKEAMQGRTYISDPKITSYQERGVQGVMYVSSPVRDVKGNPAGAIVLRFNMENIWQIVNNDFEAAGNGSFTMLIDDTNNLGIRIADSRIYNQPPNQTRYLFSVVRPIPSAGRGPWVNSGRYPDNFNYTTTGEVLPDIITRLDLSVYDRANPAFTTRFGDVPFEVSYSPIPSKPRWSYFAVVPEATYAAAANNITQTVVLVLVVAIIAIVVLALLLARLLTTPVRRISRILGRIGIGDFEARVPVRSRDELGRLGESLNAMFDNTLSLIQSREEKEVLQERITHLLEEISTVAEGDLTVQAEVTADITGAIADSFNLMIEELRKIIINIQTATAQASTFFNETVINLQQLDNVSDRQANRVTTVSSRVEDINRSIQQVSEAASVSAEVAQEARLNARQGGMAVSQTIAGMNRIRGNVQETSKKIKRLGESSQQISEIVKLIDDIADQTNMLALNAAIQAAMAGEQGKGFSVVSEEVRRLAERSANATREIAALVKSIQDDTAEAVIAMEESTREVVDGSKVADDAGRALASIEAVVDRLATLITNISLVSRQQANSSAEIARSMAELSLLTQEASSLREQSTRAVETVASTADELRVSVSAFKVGGEAVLPALINPPAYSVLDFQPSPAPLSPETPAEPVRPAYEYMRPSGFEFASPEAPGFTFEAPAAGQFNFEPSPVAEFNFEKPLPGSFERPNGNGRQWPGEEAEAPQAARTGNGGPAGNKPVVSSVNEALDFDLNSLLSDDAIFDTFFTEGSGQKPEHGLPPAAGPGETGSRANDHRRTQALG